MKPTSIDPALLDKYLQGTCTEAERVLVESWYVGLEKKQNRQELISDAEKEEVLRAKT